MTKYIVGLYATSPTLLDWDQGAEQVFLDAIKNSHLPICGLELPFWGKGLHPHDDDFLLRNLNGNWVNVLTCIPGTMQALSADSQFGLASIHEPSRQAALEMYGRARLAIKKLNRYFNKRVVIAVHLSSAPHPRNGSAEKLAESLEEIGRWDWFGAQLVIEHCDSGVGEYPYTKGFQPIEIEIDVIKSLAQSKTKFGLAINWGRSVIEHRNVQGAILHLEMARNSGLLRGLIFSGTSDEESPYGIWGDLHMPVSKEDGIEYFRKESLMTLENIQASLVAADHQYLDYLGIKVLSMPIASSPLEERVGINRDTLAILDRAIGQLQLQRENKS